MIFVPLLHYFKSKNDYSGNESGMRYLLTPAKRTVPDPDGGEGAEKEESVLNVTVWPDPWTVEFTDPALVRREVFPLTEEGREAAAQYLAESYQGQMELWQNRPSILDCEPWAPPAEEDEQENA